MKDLDNAITIEVIKAFQLAWNESIKDYTSRMINSEHTLQAAIYHHLRQSLRDGFQVFTEAVIYLPESVMNETGKSKVVIDLLVCHQQIIIAAIEIKYSPRSAPSVNSIKKDILSLSRITSRLRRDDRVSIEIPRFLSSGPETMSLSISPFRKLIFASYCKKDDKKFQNSIFEKSNFWKKFRPDNGYWQKTGSMPKNLGVALALTDEETSSANSHFYGGPFDRLSGT
jgi:hypothetical protein